MQPYRFGNNLEKLHRKENNFLSVFKEKHENSG